MTILEMLAVHPEYLRWMKPRKKLIKQIKKSLTTGQRAMLAATYTDTKKKVAS